MMRIGHRGAPLLAPENTLRAFELALGAGMDAIEFDVQHSGDGIPVVIHDETLERTTSGKGRVDSCTVAELSSLGVPTLEEVMEVFAGRTTLVIEIKAPAAAEATAALITRYAAQHGYDAYPVISFSRELLLRVRAVDDRILLGRTVWKDEMGEGPLEQAKKDGMWSINPCIDVLDEAYVRAAHAHGLKLLTWTANTKEDIARAKAWGVDGIISDHVEWL